MAPLCLWVTTALVWAQASPSAQDILDRCAQRYAQARTLTAQMEVSVGASLWFGTVDFSLDAQVARQRPNLLRLRAPLPSDPEFNQTLMVSDGTTVHLELMGLAAYQAPAPATQVDLRDSAPADPDFLQFGLLPRRPLYDDASMMDGVHPTDACRDARLVSEGDVDQGSAVVDGHPCWLVEAKVGSNTQLFWIDRGSYLLRRVWSDWSPIAGPSSMPADKPAKGETATFEGRAARIRAVGNPNRTGPATTITYHDIALDQPISPETFRYSPDAAVRVVNSDQELSDVVQEAIVPERMQRASSPPPAAPTGETAPDFTLPLVGGGELTLSSLRGKVVFLDFFAEWCPPCQQEIPELIDIHKTMGDRVTILGVLTASNLDDAGMQQYIREKGIPYPVVNAGPQQDQISQAYSVEVLPTNVVITADGRIHSRLVGYDGRDALDQAIAQALSGRAAAPTPPPQMGGG